MVIFTWEMIFLDIQKRLKMILDKFAECSNELGIIDITKFARSFGFIVNESSDLPNDINGKIISTNNNKNIILNIYFSKEQKRYTIAYLISSYLIFYNNEKFLGSHFLGSHVFDNEIEEVAAFARMLLIPDNKLKASISKDCETLAYFFKVPVEVMDKRLKEVYKKDKILQRKKD